MEAPNRTIRAARVRGPPGSAGAAGRRRSEAVTIVDDAALQLIRSLNRCEVCNQRGMVDAHHVLHRGHGGGQRIDHSYNLLAICRLCHTKLEVAQLSFCGRKVTIIDQYGFIGSRERLPPSDIQEAVTYFSNLSPKLNGTEIERRLKIVRPGVAKLVKVLLEARERSLA